MLIINLYLLSAWAAVATQADIFLLPCPFKWITGFDCPGCGFQRSLLALLKGDFQQSFQLYPPAIPILVTLMVALSARYFSQRDQSLLIKTLFLITGSIIMGSYLVKVFHPQAH